MSEPALTSRRPSLSRVARAGLSALAVLSLATGALALYGIGAADKAFACSASSETLAAVNAAAKGELAAMKAGPEPRPLPPLAFKDAAGADVGLDRFKGKIVLLNLWATWCAPCKKEMPALDRLQAEKGGADFEVVAVSLDFGTPDKPKKFLEEIGAKSLAFYMDPSGKLLPTLKKIDRATGLPTTLLIDREGCEMAHLPGPAEWASEDGKRVIEAAIAK